MPTESREIIAISQVQALVDSATSQVHYAHFIKRTNSEARPMSFAVPGVGAGLPVPDSRKEQDAAHHILTVWDLNAGNYRRLNLDTIDTLVVDDTEYRVEP